MYFLAIPILWIAVGVWMVIKTNSRGWKADVAFVLSWPVHWTLERGYGPAISGAVLVALIAGYTWGFQ